MVALVMVSKCVKFHQTGLYSKEVLAKFKVFHKDNYAAHIGDYYTRVMTISQLVFFEKPLSLKRAFCQKIKFSIVTLCKTYSK